MGVNTKEKGAEYSTCLLIRINDKNLIKKYGEYVFVPNDYKTLDEKLGGKITFVTEKWQDLDRFYVKGKYMPLRVMEKSDLL